jgi:hypothetical protein
MRFIVLLILLCPVALAADLPTTQFIVKQSQGANVTVDPTLVPEFLLASEGQSPAKGDILTCTPRAKTVGKIGETPIALTELDCGKGGKFLVEKVYFAH